MPVALDVNIVFCCLLCSPVDSSEQVGPSGFYLLADEAVGHLLYQFQLHEELLVAGKTALLHHLLHYLVALHQKSLHEEQGMLLVVAAYIKREVLEYLAMEIKVWFK